jgi:hypothetical protein
MHVSIALLLAAALALTGCATAAQGAVDSGHGTAPVSAAPRATGGVASATPGATVVPEPSPAPTTSSAIPPSALPSPPPSSLIDPAAVGAPAPVESLVLGDSISLGIANALADYGYPVIGLIGQSATRAFLQAHLSGDLAQSAGTWVIVLGTNNTGSPDDVAQLGALVDLIDSLRTPGARQQVRWVTPHRPDAYVGGRTAYTLDAFNEELSRLAGEHPWLRILDFDVLAKAHPEWFDADTAMHLHPDARGQAALVELITGPAPPRAPTRAPIYTAAPSTREPQVFDNQTMEAVPTRSPEAPASPSPTPLAEPPAEQTPDAPAFSPAPTIAPASPPANSAPTTPTAPTS